MAHVISTDRAVYWAVGNPVVASSVMETGGLTVTGLTLYSDVDENAFLGKVAGKGGTYKPLPPFGEWVEAGQIYGYNNRDLLICRKSHFRDDDDPEKVPGKYITYKPGASREIEWIAGEQVRKGMHRSYDGTSYVCLVEHETRDDLTPPVASRDGTGPILWQRLGPPPKKEKP